MLSIKERPTIFADHLGTSYSFNSGDDHKKVFGQYLTTIDIADFMVSLAAPRHCKHLNILDPGIGSGILSIALIERYAESCKGLASINLIGYETDSGLLPVSHKSLGNNPGRFYLISKFCLLLVQSCRLNRNIRNNHLSLIYIYSLCWNV